MDFIGYKIGTISIKPITGMLDLLDFAGYLVGKEHSIILKNSPDIIIATDGE